MMKTQLFLCFTALFLGTSLAFSQWTQQGMDIDGEATGDESGISVSISSDGNIIAIGANQNDSNGAGSGHVRVYVFDGVNWIQLGQDIDGEATGDNCGIRVNLSNDGNILAIGAYLNDGNGADSGHVRIYGFDGISWNQLGSDINGAAGGDRSGQSVSLNNDGSIVAIGAYRNDGNGADSGHVRIYGFDGLSWNQFGSDIEGEAAGDESGISVSLNADGSIVAIGARFNDGNGADSGHVRIYGFDGLSWNQFGSDIDGEAVGDNFGVSVSLSSDGSRIAIGARYNDSNTGNPNDNRGHARIYQFDGLNWNQLGDDIDGEATGDESGIRVRLSNDENRLAIGAYRNDGNGNDSGHVRIYGFDGLSWNQFGSDIEGEAAGDQFGISISLSNDGSRIAIGARYNDDNGADSGHVQVYTNPSLLYTTILDPYFELTLIEQGIDSEGILDGQVLTADISSIINLDVTNEYIFDLTGIENFTALEVLNCTNNWISSLDVSNNVNLVSLDCSNNRLNTLTMGNTLTTLNCSDNRFYGNLDFSAMASLTTLDATQNYRLFCIQVADEVAANAGMGIYAGWVIGPVTSYSQNCMMAKGAKITDIKNTDKDDVLEEENISTTQLKIYPNPARDQLYIALPAERELLNVIIYTMQGEKVATAKTTTIPITHLARGVYFVEVKLSDGESILKKVIVSED